MKDAEKSLQQPLVLTLVFYHSSPFSQRTFKQRPSLGVLSFITLLIVLCAQKPTHDKKRTKKLARQ